METKNNTLIIVAVALLFGLGIGYVTGVNTEDNDMPRQAMHSPESMQASAMRGMMAALEGKTDAELEKAFLDEMIMHHEGAIEMSRALLAGTNRPELVKLGNDIITAQTGEIEMMKGWRKNWFGE